MAAISNAIIRKTAGGFFFNGKFYGIAYETLPLQGNALTLMPVRIYREKIEIDITTVTITNELGIDITPVDVQERANLISLLVARELLGAVDVFIQDQTTEIVDLHLSEPIQDLTLVNDANLDDSTILVSTLAEPTNGNIICLRENYAFYQGEILAHAASGLNWLITLDTPLDFPYTTASGCSEESIKMNVNGAITPRIFNVSPKRLAAGTRWDITRLMGSMVSSTSMDDAKFGGIAALVNGIVFRKKDGIYKNLFNAKRNSDLKAHMYDVVYSDRAPSGFFGLNFRRSMAGQDKNGVALRLAGDSNDEFQCIVQDDLSALDDFQVIVQGHVVE